MRTSSLASLFAATLGLAACSRGGSSDTLPTPPEFEAAAASPEAAATPASEGRTEMIAPEDQVQFANDSTVLEPSAIAILDDVAAWVKADRSRTILVKGHADATGTVAYNLDLSSRRAETVASYLYGRGVAREQVAIVAVGEDAAVLAPATSNRRVVIYALSTGAATAAR